MPSKVARNRHRGLILFAELALSGLAVLLLVGLHEGLAAGQIRLQALGPDGRYVAFLRKYPQGGATSSDLSKVQLKTRRNPFPHTVLTGLDYGAHLSISWNGPKNLVVGCDNCGNFEMKCDACALYIVAKETSWRDVTISYRTQ